MSLRLRLLLAVVDYENLRTPRPAFSRCTFPLQPRTRTTTPLPPAEIATTPATPPGVATEATASTNTRVPADLNRTKERGTRGGSGGATARGPVTKSGPKGGCWFCRRGRGARLCSGRRCCRCVRVCVGMCLCLWGGVYVSSRESRYWSAVLCTSPSCGRFLLVWRAADGFLWDDSDFWLTALCC